MYNYNVNPINIQPFMQGLEISRQREKEQKIQDLRQRVASGDPEAFKEYSLIDPQGASAFKSLNQQPQFNSADINEFYKDAKSLYPLLESDNPMAVSVIENMLVKYKNTPFEQAIGGFMANYQQNPEATLGQYKEFLGAMPQPDSPDTRDADSKKFDRLQEIRGAYGADSQQAKEYEKLIGLTEDKKISSALEKQIITAQDNYFKNDQQARQMQVLASDIQGMDIGGGTGSTFSEALKNILGSQDEVTELRRRFNAIRTSQAVVNLPPGVASDKDIELALKGFPAENANADQIVSFLKGQEKLARITADFNRFKAEWFSEKKSPTGLLNAWKMQAEDKFTAGQDSDQDSGDNVLNWSDL